MWSRMLIASGGFTLPWRSNGKFAGSLDHLHSFIKASISVGLLAVPPNYSLEIIYCLFFCLPASSSYSCSGTSAATSSCGISKSQTPRCYRNGASVVRVLLYNLNYSMSLWDILSERDWAQKTGWTLEKSKLVSHTRAWCNRFVKHLIFPMFLLINPARKGIWSWNILSCFRKKQHLKYSLWRCFNWKKWWIEIIRCFLPRTRKHQRFPFLGCFTPVDLGQQTLAKYFFLLAESLAPNALHTTTHHCNLF